MKLTDEQIEAMAREIVNQVLNDNPHRHAPEHDELQEIGCRAIRATLKLRDERYTSVLEERVRLRGELKHSEERRTLLVGENHQIAESNERLVDWSKQVYRSWLYMKGKTYCEDDPLEHHRDTAKLGEAIDTAPTEVKE